jgi:hypothetical protein
MTYRRQRDSDMAGRGWSGHPPGPEPVVLGDASHAYRGWDSETLFDALTVHRAEWMVLLPGEVLPNVLEAERPDRVVWASFWPAAVADSVELLLEEKAGDTTVRWLWRSPTPPDERGIGISRQRLNTKLGGDIGAGWPISPGQRTSLKEPLSRCRSVRFRMRRKDQRVTRSS